MNDKTSRLLRAAFDAYLVHLRAGGLNPSERYLPYDFDYLDELERQFLGGAMVKDDLNEVTNILNHWHGSLHRWQAWNAVISKFRNEAAWTLRREFLEALAHQCLLQPSATRDTFTFVATNSMHQVRLASSTGYLDYLDGDPKSPGSKPKNQTRREKEKRLCDMTSPWPESANFMALLRKIDDPLYRGETSDYRNRSSHAIAPRLGMGSTRVVVRAVVQATKLTKQADETFELKPIPGKMSIRYVFGGTPPLDMEEARIANLAQYHRARACYEQYRRLLAAGITAMRPAVPKA